MGPPEILPNETEGIVEAEEETEARQTLPSPYIPSQSEIDDHNVDHLPYRAWCRWCVEGRGREMSHHPVDHDAHAVAIIAFDYLFATRRGCYTREEWATEEVRQEAREKALKILVVRDLKSKATFAHAVPVKGIDEKNYAVDSIVSDVKYCGYSRVILKSDNEPAIVSLLQEALKGLRAEGLEQAAEEHPPPYDYQANGGIEVGCKLVRGHLRTMLVCLEHRLQAKIPTTHAVMTWLVEHVANVLTWRVKGQDGRTPYHRLRGRVFNGKLIGSGERCRFKVRSKEPLSGGDRWTEGVYLGRERHAGRHILFDPSSKEIRHSRTLL